MQYIFISDEYQSIIILISRHWDSLQRDILQNLPPAKMLLAKLAPVKLPPQKLSFAKFILANMTLAKLPTCKNPLVKGAFA